MRNRSLSDSSSRPKLIAEPFDANRGAYLVPFAKVKQTTKAGGDAKVSLLSFSLSSY